MKSNFLLWICVILLSLIIIACAELVVIFFSRASILLFGMIATVCGIGIHEIIKTIKNN